MTIKEMVDVMLAYDAGKDIELQMDDGSWEKINAPIWNWADCVYRVKPELRPYKSAQEFLQASKIHGPYIACATPYFEIPVRVIECGVGLIGFNSAKDNKDIVEFYSYKDLCKKFTWIDGTPCGILTY